jgi:hypothetical protein
VVRTLVTLVVLVSLLVPAGAAAQAACTFPAGPKSTVYLPNVTKTLGGPSGWTTPFIVQNVDTVTGLLRIELYRFSDGALVMTREVCALAPGTSFAFDPRSEAALPGDTQYSVVVRAYLIDAVAVVNEHAGSGLSLQSAAYMGATRGATSVSLPNVTKRFFGFVTPFIIQNLGTATTTATAQFISFDGAHTASVARTIAPGRAQAVDPNAEPLLLDGTQYAVTVTATQPIAVVVNTHGFAAPRPDLIAGGAVVYASSGISEGSSPVLMPYLVKNVSGVGKGVSTVVVQNVGATPVAPTLVVRTLGMDVPTFFPGPLVQPGRSWAFDPRYVNGDTSRGLCGAAASPGCLADGEHSATLVADNDAVATVVNIIGTTAGGYSGILNGGSRVFLPNVTRRLGGASGWSTPFVVQGNTATAASVRWYRFADGALVTTQSIALGTGVSRWIDPRDVPGLTDDTQYSVVIESAAGSLGAIVIQMHFGGGDGAMIYEGAFR